MEIMRADPSLDSLSFDEVQEAIILWDAMLDDPKQMLTAEQRAAACLTGTGRGFKFSCTSYVMVSLHSVCLRRAICPCWIRTSAARHWSTLVYLLRSTVVSGHVKRVCAAADNGNASAMHSAAMGASRRGVQPIGRRMEVGTVRSHRWWR